MRMSAPGWAMTTILLALLLPPATAVAQQQGGPGAAIKVFGNGRRPGQDAGTLRQIKAVTGDDA